MMKNLRGTNCQRHNQILYKTAQLAQKHRKKCLKTNLIREINTN